MGEKLGIKETKELLKGLSLLGALVAKRLKDGVDLDDAAAIASALLLDAEFRAIVEAAADRIEMVDDELADLDFSEGLEIAAEIPAILKSISEAGSND
jgi:hypothetical protein